LLLRIIVMNKIAKFILTSLTVVLTSCGGGGGGTSSSSGTTSTYTSSGAVGEVLSYSINTTNKTYSYEILKSAYGLEGTTGSGTLTANSDGSYTPSENSNARVYNISGGLLVGSAYLNLNGTRTNVPILGVSSPVTSLSTIAGTYNYIRFFCTSPTSGTISSANCATSYGTILVNSSGSYTLCVLDNITTNTTCSNSTGTISYLSNGIWKATRTGSTANNYLLAYEGGNGQVVLLIDNNDPGGYGYGHAVASTQVAISNSTDPGTYYKTSNTGEVGTTSVTTTGFTSSYTLNGSSYTSSGTLTLNSPWNGLVAVTSSSGSTGVSIAAGSGLYAYRSNTANNYYYEVGMKTAN
jgi:hypothetical protein